MTREEAIKLLTQYIDYDAETPDYYEMEKACKVAIKALEQEPKIGRWLKSGIGGAKICSVCQAHMGLSNFKYCPNCGAKMEREVRLF